MRSIVYTWPFNIYKMLAVFTISLTELDKLVQFSYLVDFFYSSVILIFRATIFF
jgi:hypothetical protein